MSADARVGERVRFMGERFWYTVQARSRRYMVCTRPFAPKKTVIYSIVDLHKGVRGPDNMIFCAGYETQDACIERLAELKAGEIEVSRRNEVPLAWDSGTGRRGR